jgi:hypothetical protein
VKQIDDEDEEQVWDSVALFISRCLFHLFCLCSSSACAASLCETVIGGTAAACKGNLVFICLLEQLGHSSSSIVFCEFFVY